MTKDDLIEFEAEVERQFSEGNIKGPIHLCGGNEDQLIDIFKRIKRTDYIFSKWRHDYHALLHGVPPEILMAEIMAGRGMNFSSAEHRFFTSAIVGGILPIAVGVAHGIKMLGVNEQVWCFIGDMAASTGTFHEAWGYSQGHALPIRFVVDGNGMAADTPTMETWVDSRDDGIERVISILSTRTKPHAGIGRWVDIK